MPMEAGFVASRFLHLAALLLAFGVALFPFYSWRANESFPPIVRRTSNVSIAAAALVAFVSGAGWFIFTVNTMADSPSGFLDRDTIQYVTSDTDFGKLWVGRAVVAVALGTFAATRFFWPAKPRSLTVLSLSALLLLSQAGTGHTQTGAGAQKVLREGSDALHLLAAGAWLGGLVPLVILVTRGERRDAEFALTRFSGMGYLAVGTLFATGTINGIFLVGSFDGLFRSLYGSLLMIKVALFLTMVSLAGINRFILVPALATRSGALPRLRRHIFYEQLLGIGVIAIVSWLGTIPPPSEAG